MRGAVREVGTAAARRGDRRAPGHGQEGTSDTASSHHAHSTREPALAHSHPRKTLAKPGMPLAPRDTAMSRSSGLGEVRRRGRGGC